MSRRRVAPTTGRSESGGLAPGSDRLAHHPFEALKQLRLPVKETPRSAPAPRTPAPEGTRSKGAKGPAPLVSGDAKPPAAVDESAAFLAAMQGVRRLEERERVERPGPASEPREMTDEDAEALSELSDLVSGNAAFDVTQGEEYVEGLAMGVDPRLVRRLRRGEFSHQAYLDLHGRTVEEARREVGEFLQRCRHSNFRCVLIVHGRGLNSKDRVPVLKQRLVDWLAHSSLSALVLAFATARPCDGGAGAVYVLLRRDRVGRRSLRVLAGSPTG